MAFPPQFGSEPMLRSVQQRAVLPPPAAAAAAARRRPCAAPAPWRPVPRRSPPPTSSAGFHQSLLTATERTGEPAEQLAAMAVREAEADSELEAAAWLRALSFYRYPEERKFAAQVTHHPGDCAAACCQHGRSCDAWCCVVPLRLSLVA